MKAFILAAGQGKRLEPLTSETPKCLLSINGSTILEYQLVTLASANIRDIIIIAGFKAEKIKEAVRRYIILHRLNIRVKIIINKDYATTNNLYSLWLAREEMNDDILIINGDNVFARESLMKTIRKEDAHAIVAIHRHPTYDNEDMKVLISGSHVIAISKSIDNQKASAESIGLRLIRKQAIPAFRKSLDEAMRLPNARQLFFVYALQMMIDNGFHVGYADVTDHQYGELDFPEDLKRLEKSFSLYMIQNIYAYSNIFTRRRLPAARVANMKQTG